MTLHPRQSRMARSALGIQIKQLADAAKVSTNTITRLENGELLRERTLEDIRRAYEEAGARFIEEGDWVGALVHRE